MSNDKTVLPYGAWHSPITPEMLAKKGSRIGHSQIYGDCYYWVESRPQEGGRSCIVKWNNGSLSRVTPENVSVGSKVHEYGGGDFLVSDIGVFFVNAIDQDIYLITSETNNAKAITHFRDTSTDVRFADFAIDKDLKFLIAVRESHQSDRVINDLVKIDIATGEVESIASGDDFYMAPRVSPGGARLAWISWSQPQMPWDGTELWVADIQPNGNLSAKHKVIGHENESVLDPQWSPDGVLHFISDRSGYWNLYSFRDGLLNALLPTDHDCAVAPWQMGQSNYCFASDWLIYLTTFEEGRQQLVELTVDAGQAESFTLPFEEYQGQLHFIDNHIFTVCGSPTHSVAAVRIDCTNRTYSHISKVEPIDVATDYLSLAKPVTFTSADGSLAHAYFYAPNNPFYQGLDNELPPLIVISHGGPTGNTTTSLNWQIQFWTSRGFAVVDVNYRGSTGFGRTYRRALEKKWGVDDVNDCIYAARYLADDLLVDGERLLIRGGSAGGFTTLCALTFSDEFAAGMTRYGVADLETLATDTHKFEARYLDRLIGEYPAQQSVYFERSPINHTDKLSCPLLVLQGSDDKVVPPSQSQELVAALAEKDIPHAYIEFSGEGHGFRQQKTIVKAFSAELYFYRKVLKIDAEESLPKIDIANLS